MRPFIKKYPRGRSIIVLFCVVGLIFGVVPTVAHSPGHNPLGKYDSEKGCVVVDELCLVPDEVPNYEAIKTLHSQLDDDRSGGIDVTESVDFLKEELQYAKGYEKRQKVFHYNNDEYISVRELWAIWKKSDVHNWTVEQTVAWLAETVELQQYAQTFYENAVNGSVLPRLAANNEQFLTKVLGIRDPKHRSKITIKAMDVVLFGPPKGSYIKDWVLVTLLSLALFGCYKAYQRNREYEKQLCDMLTEMEKLRETEENLQQLELRMNSSVVTKEPERSHENKQSHDEEVQQLKLELEQEREKNEQMKEQMKRGQEEAVLEDHPPWCAPVELQHWLQLTYEREKLTFEKKQSAARAQFSQAKDMCDKLNHQRRSLMGVLASVHGKMDNVDQSISRARAILEEVTHELGEKDQRWKNIEILVGCNITTNAGLHTLELMLRPQLNGRPHSTYAPSIGTPRDSMVDVRGSTGSTRKRSQFISQDSGSSLSSDSSVNLSNFMHHSHTFSTGLSPQTEEEEDCIPRASSTGSINRLVRRGRGRSKDSNDSSNDDGLESAYISDTTSFSMGGSQLTLNSVSSAVSPSQEISASDTALDSPKTKSMHSLHSRRLGASPSEEGNSSDSSILEERPPSADSRKKSSKNWFRNGLAGSLKIGKSKKPKNSIIEKESVKDFTKI